MIDATKWFQAATARTWARRTASCPRRTSPASATRCLAFEETEQSKIFPNAAFGYWKVTVERPLRLTGIDPDRAYAAKEIKALKETADRAESASARHQEDPQARCRHPTRWSACSRRPSPGSEAYVEYEPDSDLRDTEQVPLLEEGGVEVFLRREVLPYAADAWYVPDSVKTGYEISFTRYFYKPKPMRTTLEEIRADILAVEKETEGLLGDILNISGNKQ